MNVVYIDNDNILELRGLQNAATKVYQNAATISVTLLDHEEKTVTGQSWPTAMSYVAGSKGIYRCILEDTLSLSTGNTYHAVVSGTSAGLTFKTRISILATERRT